MPTRFFLLAIALHNLDKSATEVQKAVELDCDFTASFCKWENSRRDGLDWRIGDSVGGLLFNGIPRGAEGFGDSFAFVRGKGRLFAPSLRSMLVSDIIPCQKSQGNLRFILVKTTLNSVLRICIARPNSVTLRCQQTYGGFIGSGWRAAAVTIPSSREPFQIIFDAQVQGTRDILAMDKILYSAAMCDTFTPPPTSPPVTVRPSPTSFHEIHSSPTRSFLHRAPTRTPGPAISGLPCDPVSCSFERTLCDWERPGLNGWRTTCSPALIQPGHSVVNAKDGTCFLMAAPLPVSVSGIKEMIFISRQFTLAQPAALHFWYFLPGSGRSRLKVCINSLSKCPWTKIEPPRRLEMWWKAVVSLSIGINQIMFIADHTGNAAVAVDDVRLQSVGSTRHPTCEFEQPEFV